MPVTAFAAPPNSSPRVVTSFGFEDGQPTFSAIVPLLDSVAIWGPMTQVARTGSRSLWCAGQSYPALTTSTLWPKYPADTKTTAILRIPEAADYYSTRVSFYYLMPTKGEADAFSGALARMDAEGNAITPSPIRNTYATVSTWTKSTMDSADVSLTRTPLLAAVNFFYGIQVPGSTRGQGPSIDDVSVSAFKYGPVSGLTGAWESGVRLNWSKPATSMTDSTPDTRSITYRVWRSASGADKWTELTSARLTSPTYLDSTAVAGQAYDYSVQAWDAADGANYGAPSIVSVATPGSKIAVSLSSLSGVISSARVNGTFTVTGKLKPRHDSGKPVKIYAYRYSGGKKVQTVTFTPSITNVGQATNTTKFSASVKLPKKGSWKLRAYHAATSTEKSAWSAYSKTITVK
jgi:hypothetical protein